VIENQDNDDIVAFMLILLGYDTEKKEHSRVLEKLVLSNEMDR
jgi:hypothetical protein